MKIIKIDSSAEGQRIDRYLMKLYASSSKNSIQKWLRKKTIKVNSSKVEPNYRLKLDDEIKIFLPDSLLEESIRKKVDWHKSKADIDIFYEDDEILIVNKPSGMLTHPADGEYKNALSTMVQSYLYESITPTFAPSSIQRLDFNTSGLVIFCKTYAALKEYNELMRARKIKKFYMAIVEGRLDEEGTIEAYLIKDEEKNRVRLSHIEKAGSKKVKSIVRPIEANDKYSKVEVELITGRAHQIRASLSYIGHPIIGDRKYGAKYCKLVNHQKLVAYKVVVNGTTYQLKDDDNIWEKLIKNSGE